jgi:hypothetical protein
MEGSFEHGDETSGSITCWEILPWLHNWQSLELNYIQILAEYINNMTKKSPG